ncbi:MAG TPA: dihydropteroate synthase [Oxalicibacterium sp.]|nr:dihydropteroate synthase [Oxalicibacterium sp.]
MQAHLQCGRYRFDLSPRSRPLVMGILNATPDSFSDGGKYQSLDFALSHAEAMIEAGVDIIDIGGESTRPGAPPLPLQQELDRVMPLIFALRDCGKAISIDTYKPEVMREALAAGADMINDIRAFQTDGAIDAVRDADCALCAMHMQNDPQTMQHEPVYEDVVREVSDFLRDRAAALANAGIEPARLCVDPGFGFGKTLAHNIALFKNIGLMQNALDLPLLVGVSRKSMIGTLIGKPVEQRMAGSVAAALAAANYGAKIVRVHDVTETVDALTIWQAMAE